MRLTGPLAEHPVESVIAGLLLALLLFISGGGPETAPAPLVHAPHAEKM